MRCLALGIDTRGIRYFYIVLGDSRGSYIYTLKTFENGIDNLRPEHQLQCNMTRRGDWADKTYK